MPRKWLPLVIIIFALAGTIFLANPPDIILPDVDAPSGVASAPISYSTEVKISQYDDNGDIDYNFTANKLTQFQPDPERVSEQDYTQIDSPLFTLRQTDKPPRFMEAKTGYASGANLKQISLHDDVRVWQSTDNEKLEELKTSELLVYLDRHMATSDKLVMMSYPGYTATGEGLIADFNLEQYRVLKNAETFHDISQ